MAKRKSRYFWHVPNNGWHSSNPNPQLGVGNTNDDIVVPLIDSEIIPVTATPEHDQWVVERIVGQWLLTSQEDAPVQHHYVHSRIYPVSADSVSVAIRSLQLAEEAESDFLWHHVSPWPTTFDTDTWGNWQTSGAGNPSGETYMGRFGHFDVRVGRRIEQGTALIWHTQMVPAPTADNDFFLKLWLRLLVREG